MNMLYLAARFAAVTIALGLCGCASIVSGRYADVHLDSHPANAHVVVLDHKGAKVAEANTPAVVSLKRNRKFFLPAKYTASFDAPGYATAQVPLRSTLNPWVAGNIVLGGPVGLIVDTATGAGWRPKHDQISQHLEPIMTAQNEPQLPMGEQPALVAELPAEDGVQPASATR
jgi:hypothetical protein